MRKPNCGHFVLLLVSCWMRTQMLWVCLIETILR